MSHSRLQPLNLPKPVSVTLDNHRYPVMVFHDPCRSATTQSREGTGEESTEGTSDSKIQKHVEAIIEIWCIDDEWWRKPISRRYVEVLLEGGAHVVLYEDLITGNWFMQMV